MPCGKSGKKGRYAKGGKTQEQMKSMGRNEAKIANQFGGVKKMAGGGIVRGGGAATKGLRFDNSVN